jgi:hypothetical protein
MPVPATGIKVITIAEIKSWNGITAIFPVYQIF